MKIQQPLPVVGEVIEVPYPFVRDTFMTHEADEEGGSFGSEIPTWKPGTCNVGVGDEEYGSVADGMGAQLLQVISVHKPGRFPTRIFYTRQWRDPDGKTFGKGSLRVLSVGGFRSLARGFRHHYQLRSVVAVEGR